MESDSSVSDSLGSVREWLRKSVNGELWKNQNHDRESTEFSSSYQGSCSDGCSGSEFEEQVNSYVPRQRHKNTFNNQIARGRPQEGTNQDRDKPFYVPRKPHFFEHDLRILGEEEVESNKKNWKKEDQDCWAHDLYDSELQKPKSKQEIIDSYGYDIRSERSFSTVQQNPHRRRSNHQKEHHDTGFRSKSKFDENFVKKTSQRQEYAHISPRIDCDKNMNTENRSLVKFKDKTVEEEPFDKPLIKSDSKFSYRKQIYHPTYILEKEENTPKPSFNSDVKIKFRSSSRNLSPNFPAHAGHSKVVNTNDVSSSTIANPVKNDSISCGATRGHGRNRDSHLVWDPENNTSTVSMPWKNSTVNESHHNNFYKNFQSFIPPNVNQGVVKMRTMNSDENLTTPQRILSMDTKIPFGNTVPNCTMASLPTDYRYCNDYIYDINNGENFIFPDPPDVSVAHLTPCIPQHHYYFTNTHPHQNFNQVYDSPMRWGYYTQSSCYQGTTSGIAYLKQHSVSSWPNSTPIGHLNHLITSPQQLEPNPYYSLHTEVNASEELKRSEEESKMDFITSAIAQLTTSTHNIHRYSVFRSKLHLANTIKVAK